MKDFLNNNKDSVIILCSIIGIVVIIAFISTIKDNWWKTQFDVSEPQYINGGKTITFDVLNKTNEDKIVNIYYVAKSGMIKKESLCLYEDSGKFEIKAGSSASIKCSVWDFDDTYNFKIKKIQIKK